MSIPSRLYTNSESLDEQLRAQRPAVLRAVARQAAHAALAATNLSGDAVGAALEALSSGNFGESAERSAMQLLADDLDEQAWRLREQYEQDQNEEGRVSYQSYKALFCQARAAASVAYALSADALEAALEAVYEAQAATSDIEAVRQAAEALLPSLGLVNEVRIDPS